MAQIICMGASTVYGVGGPDGGWADMLKLTLHRQMYGGDANTNEAHEVFIFAKSGITVDFITRGYEQRVKDYERDGRKTVIVLSVGLNNAKAVETLDGYVSSPEEYAAQIKQLLRRMVELTAAVICVGFTPVDESKTTKKINPFTQQRSYFMNQRIKVFNDVFRQATEEVGGGAQFVDLFDLAAGLNWIDGYLSSDGLHPNDKGYHWICEQVTPVVLNAAE